MTTTDDPLVSTEWLAAHIDDPNVKVIDASFKLPGVLPLPEDDYLAVAYSGRSVFRRRRDLGPLQSAAAYVPGRGAVRRATSERSGSPMRYRRAYDSGGWVAAPRAWWMFLSFGHPNVRMLDGGLKKWARKAASRTGRSRRSQGRFRRLDPSYAQPTAADRQYRDGRAIGRCPRERALSGHGARAAAGPRSGHIPGSRNVPYATCSTPRPAR